MGSGTPCRAGTDVPWDPPVTSLTCEFERLAQNVAMMHTNPDMERLLQGPCHAPALVSIAIRNRLMRGALFDEINELKGATSKAKSTTKSNCLDETPTKWMSRQASGRFTTQRIGGALSPYASV